MSNDTSQKVSNQLSIKLPFAVLVIIAVMFTSFAFGAVASGEQGSGSPESGATSRLKALYTTLQTAGYGSDTNTPDWGAYWNRVSTAAQWVPSGTAVAADVASGKSIYGSSRAITTGANSLFSLPTTTGNCSTQAYHDSYGAPVTQTANCTNNVTWTTADPAVTGDDKKDPRSSLVWSQALLNSAGTVTFTASTPSAWTWDASGANNIAVSNKTALQLCSDRGNGWRLPTQKELMQAYIDGSYFNLSLPTTTFWSATEYSSTNAWIMGLANGGANNFTKTTNTSARCVR